MGWAVRGCEKVGGVVGEGLCWAHLLVARARAAGPAVRCARRRTLDADSQVHHARPLHLRAHTTMHVSATVEHNHFVGYVTHNA